MTRKNKTHCSVNSRGKRGDRSPLMLTDSLRRASEFGPESVRLHLAQQMQMCCKHKHGGGGAGVNVSTYRLLYKRVLLSGNEKMGNIREMANNYSKLDC